MVLNITIPTFNRCHDLANLLRSIELEVESLIRKEDVSVTVLDNQSDDSTAEICNSFANRLPGFFYSKHLTNLGLTRNMYEGLAHSRGEYVWMIGDDETVLPGALNRILEQIRSNPRDLYIFNYSSEPSEANTPHLKSNYDRSICDRSDLLNNLVLDWGFLWCLGNLGMVIARRGLLNDIDYESYKDCVFAQAAWYLEAFSRSDVVFVNDVIFRTYIKSQTTNKERWELDGTTKKFFNVSNSIEKLIEKKIIPDRLPITFFNGCSTNRFPIWCYFLSQIEKSLSSRNYTIPNDSWTAIAKLVTLLEDPKLKHHLLESTFKLASQVKVVEYSDSVYQLQFQKLLSCWQDACDKLQRLV